jgi:hypothetical protein
MKNIMLTTAVCAGSIVMTGLFVSHEMFECSAAKSALRPIEVKAVATQAQPIVHYASAITSGNKIENRTSVFYNVNMISFQDEQVKADEEINEDFMIEHLPVLNNSLHTDDEMNDLFLAENNDLKFSPNLSAGDDEMNDQFHAENK